MRVRIDIGLDLDGHHTFQWIPSDSPGALEVPRTTIDRWTAEHEAFQVAFLRWKHITEEIEDTLVRAETERCRPQAALASALVQRQVRQRR